MNQRLIQLSGTCNFRDMGGYKTQDCRTMKMGLLFRSDELSRLSDNDQLELQRLNIKLIIDLRTPNERKSKPDRISKDAGIKLINIPIYPFHQDPNRLQRWFWLVSGKFKDFDFDNYMKGYYHKIAFDHATQIGEILSLISDKNNLPALFHCTGGKDRTGFATALIQLLVGVPKETIFEDYLLTNFFLEPHINKFIRYFRRVSLYRMKSDQIRPIWEARREYLEQVLDEIQKEYGTVEEYLQQECGMEQNLSNHFKEMLLE